MVAIKDFEIPSCCGGCFARTMVDGTVSTYEMCDLTQSVLLVENLIENRHKDCPLVEIEERKVGKWIVSKDSIYCPFCNTRQKIGTAEVELLSTVFTGFKFCKYCGAEMVGNENG